MNQSRELIISLYVPNDVPRDLIKNNFRSLVKLSDTFHQLAAYLPLIFNKDCSGDLTTDDDDADYVRYVPGDKNNPASIVISSPRFASDDEVQKAQDLIEEQLQQYRQNLSVPTILAYELD